jgi:hypothetical protein
MSRRAFLRAAAAVAAGVCLGPPAAAQPVPGTAYRRVEPAPAPGDKPDIWTLGFEYIPPRIATLDVPGQGRRQVWYMPYRIYNPTPNPQQLPSLMFELVTTDLNTRHRDEPQPSLFEAIRKREDPDRTRPYLSTVEVAREKIPVTRPDSYPRYVYGIAIWTEVPQQAGKTNRFSVYVTGLSDGIVAEPLPDGGKRVRVKTLKLDFFKPTDDNNPGAADIKPEDNRGLGGERWMYRAVPTDRKPGDKKDEKKEPEKKDEGK